MVVTGRGETTERAWIEPLLPLSGRVRLSTVPAGDGDRGQGDPHPPTGQALRDREIRFVSPDSDDRISRLGVDRDIHVSDIVNTLLREER